MKILGIIWTVIWNIIALAIFGGMLSATNTSFQTIVVAGLGLIYVTIVFYGTAIARTQLTTYFSVTDQFIREAKLNGHGEHVELDESSLKAAMEKLNSKNISYYINVSFNSVIWLISIFAIMSSL